MAESQRPWARLARSFSTAGETAMVGESMVGSSMVGKI
jgi:hypothetical protein